VNRIEIDNEAGGKLSNGRYSAMITLSVVSAAGSPPKWYMDNHSRNFLSTAATIALLPTACGSGRQEYFYQTLSDADKAGEITRGWIPDDLVPSSSRAIHLVEELSPSMAWCAFEFLPADSLNLRKNLKSVDALPPSVSRVSNPDVSWWPEVLRGNLDVAKISKAGFQLYVIEKPKMGIYLFALDWSKGHGFFYCR